MVTTEGSCRRRSQIRKVCCAIGSIEDEYWVLKRRMTVTDAALGTIGCKPLYDWVPWSASCQCRRAHVTTSAYIPTQLQLQQRVRKSLSAFTWMLLSSLSSSLMLGLERQGDGQLSVSLSIGLSRGSSFRLAQSQQASP